MTTHVKKQSALTAIIVALIASFVIGSVCLVSSAFAGSSDNTDPQTCTATAKITATFDGDGNITIPDTELKNDTDCIVVVHAVSIESDYDFIKDWTNDFAEGTTINPGECLTIKWSANSQVPTGFDATTEVHVGTITYHYTLKKVLPDNIALDPAEFTYDGSAKQPEVKGLEGLVEGRDYTLSYENNINAGKATVTVTGIGYYAGSAKEFTFTINPASIADAEITTEDLTYKGNETQTAIITSVTLNGKELALDGDYRIASGNKGTNAGTYDNLTIEGIGNYAGTATGSFTINKLDISKADVVIATDPAEAVYTGSEIAATVEGITLSGIAFQDGDYEVDSTSQLRGTEAGTYNVSVNGTGNCTGVAKGSWTIGTNPLNNAEITVEDFTYDGRAHAANPVVKLGGKTLVENQDYTLSGDLSATDVSSSSYQLIVTGMGNYSGEKTKSWNINPCNLANAELTITQTTDTYTGSNITATVAGATLADGRKVTLTSDDFTTGGTTTATNADTYNITITGKGNYTGTSKQGSWVISKAPITVSGITASNKTYDGGVTATLDCSSAKLTGLVEGESLSVTATGAFDDADGKGKDVGTGKTVAISGLTLKGAAAVLANYELAAAGQQSSATANIAAKPVAITWSPEGDASYAYNGSDQAPTATVDKADIVGEDAVGTTLAIKKDGAEVTTGGYTNVGRYSAEVTGLDNPNYTLSSAAEKTKDFTIAKAAITVSGITAGNKTYDGNTNATLSYDNATLSGRIDADRDKLSVSATAATFDSKDVGAGKTVAISGLTLTGDDAVLANYELATTGQQASTTADIAAREVVITWDPEGEASYFYDGNAHAPTAKVGNVVADESLDAMLTYKNSSDVVLSGAPSAIGTYIATVESLTAGAGTIPSNYQLPTEGLTKDFAIKKIEAGNYWLAATNAENPEADVYKGQAQIDADIAKIKQEIKDGTYTNANSTYKEYEALMANETYHLYTKWNSPTATESSSAVTTGKNAYVEFRIIQVGAHDGDESAVTFMATHSLPTAKHMNYPDSNAGSWESSQMRTDTMTNYVKAGLSGLCKDDESTGAKTITKVTTSGSYGSWTEGSKTSDQFWLLSHTEVFGTDGNTLVPGYYKAEGTQYAWFANKGVNARSGWDTLNSAIENMNLTRAGDSPAGYNDASWQLRSPGVNYYRTFGSVGGNGYPNDTTAYYLRGVVPAFSM